MYFQVNKGRIMKSENKNIWLVWAIIALALMNLSTIITVVYQQRKSAKADSTDIPGQFQSENESMKYSGRYFRDQLNLTRAQMNSFVQFNPVFRQQMMSLNVGLGRVRQKMLTEMSAKNSDLNKLNVLSDSIGYLHSNLKKLTCRYYIDIKNICDQEQQEKLRQMFAEMFDNDFQMGQYGTRGPYGRRYGRR